MSNYVKPQWTIPGESKPISCIRKSMRLQNREACEFLQLVQRLKKLQHSMGTRDKVSGFRKTPREPSSCSISKPTKV